MCDGGGGRRAGFYFKGCSSIDFEHQQRLQTSSLAKVTGVAGGGKGYWGSPALLFPWSDRSEPRGFFLLLSCQVGRWSNPDKMFSVLFYVAILSFGLYWAAAVLHCPLELSQSDFQLWVVAKLFLLGWGREDKGWDLISCFLMLFYMHFKITLSPPSKKI